MPRPTPPELLERARAGERGPLARLISLVEQGGPRGEEVGRLIYPLGGRTMSVGLTGAPGAGKSTLTGGIIGALRGQGTEVAVLAIDPSSPFSGGAILGDRVRMQDHFLDPGVFIRSMATRGHLGGLAAATLGAVEVLDAVGFPVVLIETVGVGQVEVEVAGAADTTVVTVNPGWGDAVQANKAGLMEIADLFVINKADRPGVAETRRDLEQMLDLSEMGEWRPPIVATVGATGQGVDELCKTIAAHQEHLVRSGLLAQRRAARAEDELRRIVVGVLDERAERHWRSRELADLRHDLAGRRTDPWSAAEEILARIVE
jgi:LAO/AO transport system kinase